MTQVYSHRMVEGAPGTEIQVHRGDDVGDSHVYELRFADGRKLTIPFQVGDPEKGVNGGTLEAYIATCAERLRQHQAGDYACDENARAIGYLSQALGALSERSARVAREEAEAAAKAKADAPAPA